MRDCSCSLSTRPSACMTDWRCSLLSAPLPLWDLLCVLRSSAINGFYSSPPTRAVRPLCSGGGALPGQQVRWPRRGRAVGAADLVRVAGREVGEQLPIARLAQLRTDRADGRLDHRVAVAAAHQVRAHLLEVLVGRLNQDHAGALRAQLLRLAA